MSTPKPREPKKTRRPKQDMEEWPGSLWTALALDRAKRDCEEKS